MKCYKCGKEIKHGERYYTAVGMIKCEECNKKDGGTVSLDDIFDKIIKESDNKKQK